MSTILRYPLLAALALGAMLPALASAQIYLRYGPIQGDVTSTGYENSISIQSVQWGIDRQVAFVGGGGPQLSSPIATEVTLTKFLDSASVELAMEALSGGSRNASIFFVESFSNPIRKETTLRLDLCDAYVTSVSTSGEDGGAPFESVAVAFKIMSLRSWDFPPGGASVLTGNIGWNFAEGVAASCGGEGP